MSPEFIAIIATSAFQSSLLMVGLWMLYRLGKILERIEGIDAAIFHDGRRERAQIKATLAEVDRMIREELLKK